VDLKEVSVSYAAGKTMALRLHSLMAGGEKMERKRVSEIVVILFCAVFTANCSFFMKPAPSDYKTTQTPDCTDSYIVPTSDLLQSVGTIILGLIYTQIGSDRIKQEGYVYLGTGALYGGSAIYGYITASKCRKAREKHDTEMQRLLSRIQLPNRSAPPPTPKADPWDAERVIGILKHHKLAISECMHRQAKADSNVKGKLTATFTVAPDGRVTSVDITAPEFANTVIADCLNDLIRSIQFPRFEGQPEKVPFFFDVK
jgi:hypothetical protein